MMEKAGADGLEIDINEEKPVMHQGYAGHGGSWTIQYPLRWISEISPQVNMDISGSEGVCAVEDEKCDGCGLCVEVCPKENIRMVEN